MRYTGHRNNSPIIDPRLASVTDAQYCEVMIIVIITSLTLAINLACIQCMHFH